MNPKCTKMRRITLFVENRRTTWLDIKDVNWATRYLYAQHQLRGVEYVPADSSGPQDDATETDDA